MHIIRRINKIIWMCFKENGNQEVGWVQKDGFIYPLFLNAVQFRIYSSRVRKCIYFNTVYQNRLINLHIYYIM